jgi:hypothetical protein
MYEYSMYVNNVTVVVKYRWDTLDMSPQISSPSLQSVFSVAIYHSVNNLDTKQNMFTTEL